MRIRPTRRRFALAVVAVAVAVAAFTVDPSGLLEDDEVAAGPVVRDTVDARVATLTTEFGAEATLRFRADTTAYVIAPPAAEVVTTTGSGRSASTQVTLIPPSMVVTQLAAEGTIVEAGHVLWRLGNEPTVVLYGSEPSYRALEEGDEGADVRQLEEALVALGHDPDGTVTVDETYTAATEAMVERWQESVGADVDGVVHHGSIVYVDGPSRVGDTDLAVGDTALDGQAAFDLRTLETELTFELEPADRETLVVGDRVDVRGTGSTASATVVSATVTDTGGVIITAQPDGPVELTSDESPVDVTWSLRLTGEVVTVPAESIVRTDDQRTWVEVRDPEGAERWVEVEIGRVSDGQAEVVGAVQVGDQVITP